MRLVGLAGRGKKKSKATAKRISEGLKKARALPPETQATITTLRQQGYSRRAIAAKVFGSHKKIGRVVRFLAK